MCGRRGVDGGACGGVWGRLRQGSRDQCRDRIAAARGSEGIGGKQARQVSSRSARAHGGESARIHSAAWGLSSSGAQQGLDPAGRRARSGPAQGVKAGARAGRFLKSKR